MDASAYSLERIGSHRVCLKGRRASCRLHRWLAIAVFIPMLWITAGAQEQGPTTISGTVRDVAGAPIGDANVRLDHDGTLTAVTRTNVDGDFTFSGLAAGVYTVIAEKPGWGAAQSSIRTDGSQSQRVDLKMQKASAKLSPSRPGGMEFADEPNFTIAAVTDWTAAGGHGSDMVLRASEELNRETISLKPEAEALPQKPATGASEQQEKALQASLAKAPEQFATNHALGAFYLAAARDGDAVPPLEAAY